MLKGVADLTNQDFSGGINTIADIFKIAENQTVNAMDVKFHFDGSIEKRFGSQTMNAVALSTSAGTTGVTTAGWACFDFGVNPNRWLVIPAGTGIYASSDLGVNFVHIATDRSTTYQWLTRSKNVLIACSDAYDNVIFWDGSAGTNFATISSNATATKYAINFQGFLILLNSEARPRGFFYEDDNTQLTGRYEDDFDLPSEDSDEITTAFILRKKLYISTRYKLFRLTFVGGNPDWSFQVVKDFGFVPRTVDKLFIKDIGEVAVGETWDRRIRFFDGGDDRIASDNIEQDNNICDFAMSKTSYAGSGLVTNFGVTDENEQTYRLTTIIGENSTEVTHAINLDGRTLGFYPYQNQKFQSSCMAESANRRFLVAIDQSGFVHMLNSGNQDVVTPVDDIYNSRFLFDKSPSQVSKAKRIDHFFTSNACGDVFYSDRNDFSSTFKLRKIIRVNSSGTVFQHHETTEVPSVQNVYQYQISSSSGTNVPWRLNRTDFFVKGLGIGKEAR